MILQDHVFCLSGCQEYLSSAFALHLVSVLKVGQQKLPNLPSYFVGLEAGFSDAGFSGAGGFVGGIGVLTFGTQDSFSENSDRLPQEESFLFVMMCVLINTYWLNINQFYFQPLP